MSAELEQMYENLTAVQTRCTELLDDVRALRHIKMKAQSFANELLMMVQSHATHEAIGVHAEALVTFLATGRDNRPRLKREGKGVW